ncbi:MAG: site-specific integrase [Candidatus Bathyarchaeia archaeon]
MPEIERSPYSHLLKDADFKRWVDNVRRGSETYGYEVLRRMGYLEKRFKKSPKDFARMTPKQATNFILDMVSEMEAEKKSGSYISNCVKAVKSWLDFNGKHVQQKIKISNREELVRFADERPPTQEELRKILNSADLRTKSACSIVAFSGLRLETLGSYLGNDGLKIMDFPEMKIKGGLVEFADMPTIVIARKSLSKIKRQYFTFLSEEGCDYLKEYLEFRLREGQKLSAESPIITPSKPHLAGHHIRTTNIGDLMRKPIRAAGFKWRPYVLRRYFDTRLMMAEADGLIINDWRVFFMGHKGSMEATYTVNKGLPKDVVDKMREAYGKAAEKYLETSKKRQSSDEVLARVNRQFLAMTGYSEKEIEALGDLSQKSEEEMQQLVKERQMTALGLNGNRQKIIPLTEVRSYVAQGWEYVTELPNSEAVIRLPTK